MLAWSVFTFTYLRQQFNASSDRVCRHGNQLRSSSLKLCDLLSRSVPDRRTKRIQRLVRLHCRLVICRGPSGNLKRHQLHFGLNVSLWDLQTDLICHRDLSSSRLQPHSVSALTTNWIKGWWSKKPKLFILACSSFRHYLMPEII